MKKLSVFALAALLLVAFTAPAMAIEHQFGGMWFTKFWTNKDFHISDITTPAGIDEETEEVIPPTDNNVDQARVDTRTRLYYTAVFSENFKFVNKFEMDAVWGDQDSASYGDLGADGVKVEVKHSYADFNLGVNNFRVGVSGQWMGKGYIFDYDAPNVTWIGKFSDMVTLAAAWTRATEGGKGKDPLTLEKMNDYDADFYFFTPTLSFGEGMTLEFPIALYNTDNALLDANIWWFGVQFDGAVAGLTYDVNFYMNAGDANDVDQKGYALSGGLGFDMGMADVYGSFAYCSGDDDPLDGENSAYRGDWGFVGFSEVLGEGTFWADTPNSADYYFPEPSNIFWLKAGAGFKPMENLKLNADIIWAKLAEENAFGEDELGVEFDVKAAYTIIEGLKLDIIGGYLWAGDGVSPTGTADNDPWELGAQLSLSF